MPILLTCPGCTKTLKAPDSVAGRKVKCPQCGTVLDVPAPAAEPPTAVSATPPPPMVEPARPPHYQAADAGPPPREWDRGRPRPVPAPAGGEGGLQLGLGIASLATGAVGLLVALIPCVGYVFGMPIAGIGLLLGLVGLIVALNQKGRGIAFPIAGSATSVLGLGVGLYWMIVVARVTRTVEDVGHGFKQAIDHLKKLPPPGDVALAAQKQQTKNNLKMIGLAFHAFHDANKRLPEAAGDGAAGKGGLSWRVALLPYLEEGNLYNQFRRNEPWDSPHNKQLLDRMPKVYASPRGNAPPNHTYYQVFTGPNTAFAPGKVGRLFATFRDGTSNTFLVAEGARAVPWTKPEDLPFDRNGPLPALGGMFPDGFHAGLADGDVRFIRRGRYNDDLLRNLIDPADGNVINWPD
ncbi:MAG: DUF1559 domain-containing protein [Gemmataceae bacterium]|nr:DUF1559 domain-containing protein [Gemmataceae bacterium]